MATAPDHAHSHDGLTTHSHGETVGPMSEAGVLAPAAASARVALDAGSGALVILPGERSGGAEIEISRVDADEPHTHTGVAQIHLP